MEHKFDVASMEKLDHPKRRETLQTERIIELLAIGAEDVVADIGCGTGYFSLPMAKIVKQVLAVDLSPEMLSELMTRADREGLSNIVPIQSSEADTGVEGEAADLVLLCTVAHELADPASFMKECRRILKPDGRIAIVDWTPFERDYGPPASHCLTSGYCKGLLEKTGFTECKATDLNRYFYLVTGKL